MKYYTFLLTGLLLILLGACNHNDEPPTEVNLSISQQFLPVTVEFSVNDSEFVESAKEFDGKHLIVNSAEELPDDPIGFSRAYRNIDFETQSLFLAYHTFRWSYETYVNRFYRNRLENCYYWQIHLGLCNIPEPDSDLRWFNRFAIVVKKLPADSNVKFEVTLGSLGTDWSDRPSQML